MSLSKDDPTYAMYKNLMQLDESDTVSDDQTIPNQNAETSSSSDRRRRKRPRLSTPSPPSTTQALSSTRVAGTSSLHSVPQEDVIDRHLVDAMIFDRTDQTNDSPSPMTPDETEDFVNTAAQLAVCNFLPL